jgi:hypothetical protein
MFVVACTGMIKPNYCQRIDLKEFKLIATSGNQPIFATSRDDQHCSMTERKLGDFTLVEVPCFVTLFSHAISVKSVGLVSHPLQFHLT